MTRLTLRERIFGQREFTADEQRTLTRPDDVPASLFGWAPAAGSVNTTTAMTIADVYAAVRLLSDSAASLPLHVYRSTSDGRERVEGGQTFDLLRNPAPAVTSANFIGTLMAHLALNGNAFAGKYRRDGRIRQLGPLSPDRVTVAIEDGQPVYTLTHRSGAQTKHSTEDIIHFRGISTDGLVGLSPVRQCATALGLSDSLAKYARTTFDNGAIPRGILKLQHFGDTEAQVDALREGWEGTHQGVDNAGRIAVVSGEVDYTSVELSPADAEILESRKWSTTEVAKVFRVPAHLLGAPTGDSLTYATSETIALDFARYSLAPWLSLIEQRLSADRDLFSANTFCEFSLDGFLRADAKTRAEIHALSLDPEQGWRTRDEVRRLENLPPDQQAPTPEQIIGRSPAAALQAANGNGNGAS